MSIIGTRPLLTHTLSPTLDTGVYASGDVFFVPTELQSFWSPLGQSVLVQSLYVYDASAQSAPFDLIFTTANTTWGAINSAAAPADSVTGLVTGYITVVGADYIQLGTGARAAMPTFNPFLLAGASNANASTWVVGIIRGAHTFAADALKLRIGVVIP